MKFKGAFKKHERVFGVFNDFRILLNKNYFNYILKIAKYSGRVVSKQVRLKKLYAFRSNCTTFLGKGFRPYVQCKYCTDPVIFDTVVISGGKSIMKRVKVFS